jgi:hypothetical protein
MIGAGRAARRLRETSAEIRPRDAGEKNEAVRVGSADGALHNLVGRLQLLQIGNALVSIKRENMYINLYERSR